MRRRYDVTRKHAAWTVAGSLMVASILALAVRGESLNKTEKAVKAVIHINFGDSTRQGNGLKNVENILRVAETEGSATQLEVVCHSDGITLLERAKTGHASVVESLRKKGVTFAACQNTMRQRAIRPEDLLGGTMTVPSGAFEVVRRQQDGYAYFKP